MMGIHTSRQIITHFVWTLSIATLLFKVGGMQFQFVLLFNAAFAAGVACMRRESWRVRKITLWDEAAAFVGICGLVRLWQ
jgi:hypothetical protein